MPTFPQRRGHSTDNRLTLIKCSPDKIPLLLSGIIEECITPPEQLQYQKEMESLIGYQMLNPRSPLAMTCLHRMSNIRKRVTHVKQKIGHHITRSILDIVQ